MVNNLKKAYSEVDEFLEILGNDYKSKIPEKLLNYIKEEKDESYKKEISIYVPIYEQHLMNETLQIIAFLNLKYWCIDENEKNRLINAYEKNRREKEKIKLEKFDYNELFGKDEKIKIEKLSLTTKVRKEGFFEKILRSLRSFFKLK